MDLKEQIYVGQELAITVLDQEYIMGTVSAKGEKGFEILTTKGEKLMISYDLSLSVGFSITEPFTDDHIVQQLQHVLRNNIVKGYTDKRELQCIN